MGRTRNTEMPNLFVIGAAKCGTTSLHYYLDLHPEISMSRIKEPHFFLGPDALEPGRPWVSSREEYLDLFDAGLPIRGEASVNYATAPCRPGVPGRIAAESPNAKFIYMVRDPIARIRSGTRARIANGHLAPPSRRDPGSFWSFLEDPESPANHVVLRSRYMTQIREYLEFFPAESIMVIDTDQMLRDRVGTVARVFDFLGVDSGFRHPNFLVERNTGSTQAHGSLNSRLRKNETLRRLSVVLPEPTRKFLIESLRRFTGREIVLPEMEPELRAGLESVFRPEVEALRGFTGQKFDGWSI